LARLLQGDSLANNVVVMINIAFALTDQQAKVLLREYISLINPATKLANMERHNVFKYFENDPGP
jgi:hypothetical protein